MKPRNKLERRVTELSQKLPKINQKQLLYAREHCFEHTAYRISQGTKYQCLDCGAVWVEKENNLLNKLNGIACPACKHHLEVVDTRKRKKDNVAYFAIVTTKDEFQIIRYFFLKKEMEVGKPACHFCEEVVQQWINEAGKNTVIALPCSQSFYCDAWIFGREMSIKQGGENYTGIDKYSINPYKIYPKMEIIPTLKRNGFKSFYQMNPLTVVRDLLTSPRHETLYKAGYIKEFRHFNNTKLDKYWGSLKICIRNNYKISDISMWCDYIDFLKEFDKDVLNAKYACPENLKTAHDYWMKRKIRKDEKEKAERKKQKLIEDEAEFIKLKSSFFGICFSDNEIDVKVLDSVLEYIQEADTLKHCVFASGYHTKPNTLILSARIDGKPIETIEISLKDFRIIQCYGKNNQNTEYHDRIMKLVNENVHLIRERKMKKRIKTQLKTAV